MFRSFPRTREPRATSAGVRGPWVPAFAGTSGDEHRFNLVRACSSATRTSESECSGRRKSMRASTRAAPKISLVLADVDGTLVTAEKVLTARAVAAVQALHAA